MKKLLLISLLIFLPIVVYSQTIYLQSIAYLGIENEINGDIVYTRMDITFSYPNAEKFVFPVYSSVSDLYSTSDFGSDCFLEKRTYGSDIICSLDNLTKEERTLKINFTASGLIKKNKTQLIFSNDIFIPQYVVKLFYQVALPAGGGLPQDKSSISPSGWDTKTDGRRILIFWDKDSISEGQLFSANVVYEQFSIIENFLPIQVLIVIGAVGIVLVVFFLQRRRSMLQVVMPILKDDEKRIFEAIMKHGKIVHQKMIVKDSNYSKAKVSKVLKSLEQRGLVKLERVGRSNKVHMMKNFPEKEEKVPGNN